MPGAMSASDIFLSSKTPLLLAVALVVYILQIFIYAFFISPVRHFPAPWYVRVSRLPLLYATYKFRRTAWVASLMRDYNASTIVIAPDEILTTDEAAMKVIYDKSAIKTRFYEGMGSWKGVKAALAFVDYAGAAPLRKNLLQCFQNRNLALLVENMQGHVMQLVEVLRAKSEAGEKVDGVVVFRLLALDVVTDVLWGEQQTLLGSMDASTSLFLRRFHAFSRYNAFKASVPGADLYVRLFGTKKWRQLRNDLEDLDITAKEALQRHNEKDSQLHNRDVLSMLRSMGDVEDPSQRMPDEHLPAQMVEMLAAGSSTTSLTMAITSYRLARNTDAQRKLREELSATYPDTRDINPQKMISLPYLDGVIKETMRMYPAIPGPLVRYLGKDITIDGHRIPAGIVASTSAYTQGRRPDVFAKPEEWIPDRWLEATERMELNWIPFGTGSRACPGSNLALTELKYAIGTIFRLFSSQIPEGHENDTMELADIFAAGTTTGSCWLKFVAEN